MLAAGLSMSLSLSLAALALAPFTRAFHEFGGPACTTAGSPCSFTYANSDAQEISVSGFCAPNGFCSDNGDVCSSDDNCYNFCGTDFICGGLASACTATNAFEHGQTDVACFDPSFICEITNTEVGSGTCIDTGIQPSVIARRRKRQEALEASFGPAAVAVVQKRASLRDLVKLSHAVQMRMKRNAGGVSGTGATVDMKGSQ